MNNNLKRWLPILVPVGWGLAIFAASSIPGHSIQKMMVVSWDKLYHLAEFGVLVVALAWTMVKMRTSKWSWMVPVTAFAIGAVYAPIDEFHQALVPGRDMSILDMAADWAGCTAGMIGAFWIRK